MRLSPGRGRRYRVLDEAVASQGRRRWMANAAAVCSWRSSCKSPRTLPKCKCLITKQLTFIAVRGGINLSPPSTVLKANHLCIWYLCFESVRGDLQEAHVYDKRLCGYASRCQLSLFPVPIPVSPSTKSGFLCAFGVWNPRFRAFRAQNRGFCAFLAFETPVFGHFEHKIGVFVRF